MLDGDGDDVVVVVVHCVFSTIVSNAYVFSNLFISNIFSVQQTEYS